MATARPGQHESGPGSGDQQPPRHGGSSPCPQMALSRHQRGGRAGAWETNSLAWGQGQMHTQHLKTTEFYPLGSGFREKPLGHFAPALIPEVLTQEGQGREPQFICLVENS